MAAKSFTVHLGPSSAAKGGDPAVEIVPDTFTPIAFVLPWVYFLRERMWLETLAYLVLLGLLIGGSFLLGLPDIVRPIVTLLTGLLFGLEAPSLKRWHLARRGYREAAVIVAANKDEAERRWFDEADARRAPPPSMLSGAPTSVPRAGPQAVFGLFPEADKRPRGSW